MVSGLTALAADTLREAVGLLTARPPPPGRRRICPPATGSVPEPDPSALGWRFSSAPLSGGGLSLTRGYERKRLTTASWRNPGTLSCSQGFK